MPQPCAITTCKRTSRALCHCCHQNLCMIHLNEHYDLLSSQLNPFVDEINKLEERLKTFNIQNIIDDCDKKLEEWRQDCYKKIDHFIEQKRHEFVHIITETLDKQQKHITDLQLKIAELIRDQAATHQDINMLTSSTLHLTREFDVIEQTNFRINTCPLLINDHLMHIKKTSKLELDLSSLSPIYKTINRPANSCKVIAANDRFLLMLQESNLCLIDQEITIVKQTSNLQDTIFDLCWSSTIERFIVIAKNNIYLVDENTMAIETVQLIEKRQWFSCTCSDEFLFLSTTDMESSIVKFKLSVTLIAINEWKSPHTCTTNERIDDIIYNNGMLGIMIAKTSEKIMKIELRSSDTLDRIWILSLDVAYNESLSTRCCSINCDEWLVADFNGGHLLQITKDGKLKMKIQYDTSPYRISLFGTNMLAIVTENAINFHKI